MKVIFYSLDEHGAGSQVQQMISAKIPREEMEVYRSPSALSKRLRYRSHDIAAAVLVVSGTDDLESLVSLRDLLEGIRTILILPNGDQGNLSLGRLLYPRFIGYADGSLDDIAAVINNLFGTGHNLHNG